MTNTTSNFHKITSKNILYSDKTTEYDETTTEGTTSKPTEKPAQTQAPTQKPTSSPTEAPTVDDTVYSEELAEITKADGGTLINPNDTNLEATYGEFAEDLEFLADLSPIFVYDGWVIEHYVNAGEGCTYHDKHLYVDYPNWSAKVNWITVNGGTIVYHSNGCFEIWYADGSKEYFTPEDWYWNK